MFTGTKEMKKKILGTATCHLWPLFLRFIFQCSLFLTRSQSHEIGSDVSGLVGRISPADQIFEWILTISLLPKKCKLIESIFDIAQHSAVMVSRIRCVSSDKRLKIAIHSKEKNVAYIVIDWERGEKSNLCRKNSLVHIFSNGLRASISGNLFFQFDCVPCDQCASEQNKI